MQSLRMVSQSNKVSTTCLIQQPVFNNSTPLYSTLNSNFPRRFPATQGFYLRIALTHSAAISSQINVTKWRPFRSLHQLFQRESGFHSSFCCCSAALPAGTSSPSINSLTLSNNSVHILSKCLAIGSSVRQERSLRGGKESERIKEERKKLPPFPRLKRRSLAARR